MARRVFAKVDHTKDLSDSEQRQQADAVYNSMDRYNVGSVAIIQGTNTWVELVGADSDVSTILTNIGNTQFAAAPPTNLSDQGDVDQHLGEIYVEAATDCRHWET